ncbi:NADH dehydrogenase subunit A [Seinonella peptonophila]|uniref:NADH-quinone oxidoreductase subunit A n=1 Tax=Seinonella peptonophila TaxID=112248 RepID=A0A1M4XTH3_9BACL|nr:NADH-quinone oxidoreductase subunit A [Seinonella peptonophila]SHE96781.1 NADH dehydrogenase subunit A [Seinonella peptonophila]
MNHNLLVITLFLVLGLALPIAAFTLSRFLRPDIPSVEKRLNYESGLAPQEGSWVQFHVRYYLFALLFVIFDVETAFLYPWAVVYDSLRSSMGLMILGEMVLFLFFLVLGLVYAWKKKVLEWK